MKISVAICTWNRSKLLDQTLTQMRKVNIPKAVELELVIVNNNCTDDTDEVISRHSSSLPISRIFESRQGHSNSRNAAVDAAKGEYILWTDDDVLVDELWVQAYVEAFERWPEAAIFGGPIDPWFESKPPKWLEEVWGRVAPAYAVRNLGPDSIPIDEKNLPFGANFALSLPFQKQYRYDPTLGRKGNGMLGGDEVTLMTAMLRDGLQGIWVPNAKVRHFIPSLRQTTNYLRRYFRGQGVVSSRRLERTGEGSQARHLSWLIFRAAKAEMKYHLYRLFSPPSVWIEHLLRASILWGRIQGYSSRSIRLNGKFDSFV
ncbi:MAG: glycosyltransferase [Desulforhabdus sp.]|jgi:glycosyltransferase involved in cell wall biosynthesis|nr:glycosyltransferase [Desulforhabdus sp.]